MREFCELRIPERLAHLVLRRDEGVRLGDSVRKITLDMTSPRWREIEQVIRDLRRQDLRPYSFWEIKRKYTEAELAAAELFVVHLTATFEPAGEMCGTLYDDVLTCPECGANALQVSDLRLDFRKIPRGKDIARTIADEVIISHRLVELFVDAGISGFSVTPARHRARYSDEPIDHNTTPTGRLLLERAKESGIEWGSNRYWIWVNHPEQAAFVYQSELESADAKMQRALKRKREWPIWYQFKVDSRLIRIAAETQFGDSPFVPPGYGRCSRGDLLGLRRLTEFFVSRSDWDGSDIAQTKEFVGVRMGVLRPHRIYLASQKVRRLVAENNVKGIEFEIAHLV